MQKRDQFLKVRVEGADALGKLLRGHGVLVHHPPLISATCIDSVALIRMDLYHISTTPCLVSTVPVHKFFWIFLLKMEKTPE